MTTLSEALPRQPIRYQNGAAGCRLERPRRLGRRLDVLPKDEHGNAHVGDVLTTHNGHNTPVYASSRLVSLVGTEFSVSRDELYTKLRSEGIYGRRYFYPLITDFPMYRSLSSAARSNLPNAVKAASEVICLPIYPTLDEETQDKILSIIAD